MQLVSRRADLLERAIEGIPCTDPQVRDLVATLGRIPALTSPACAPRDEFVAALGLRLRAEALTLPARAVRRVSRESEGKTESQGRSKAGRSKAGRSGSRPRVLVIGGRLPRAIAGATASLLLVGAVVGGASRSALPGGLLYSVKQVFNSAAVQLAGSDFDRGTTLLSQAQEHISDGRALVERDEAQAEPASVDQSLISAYDAVSTGQRTLLGDFDRTGNPQALIAVQDFTARELPQLNALRPLVPAGSRPEVDALIALLQQTRTTLAQRIAVCGQPCASLAGVGPGGVRLGDVGTVSSPPSPSSGVQPSAPPAGGRSVPGVPTLGGLPPPPVHQPTAAVTVPGGAVVVPAVPRLPANTRSTPGAILPPVTIGSPTIGQPPVVTPPELPVSLPTVPALPPPPTGLPGAP
jgi:hypothetical protein